MNIPYHYSPEQIAALNKLDSKTVSFSNHKAAMVFGSPLVMVFDNLIKYAKLYKKSYDKDISNDYIIRDTFLTMLKNARGLICIGCGQFNNGVLEEMYWKIGKSAGFSKEELED